MSSRSNPAIKRIRSLRTRRGRDQSGLFLAEGIRIVGEAVETGARIEHCVIAPHLLTSDYGLQLVSRMNEAGVLLLEVSDDVYRSLSVKEGSQGLAVVAHQQWKRLDELDPRGGLCWVVLDEAQDPGNLGTIIRTADAVGAAGIVLTGPSTDPYDPGALRASMGAIFCQHLARTSFDELIAWARRHGCMIVGTSDGANVDYRKAAYRRPLVLLMGGERRGLVAAQQNACDLFVSIPMVGRSDSLNLAVATGVILYEIFDQCYSSGNHE